MSVFRLAEAMHKRMPWRALEQILVSNNIARGHGLDKTIDKLKAESDKLSPKLPALSEALRQHILCGEKLVEFYRLNPESISSLREKIEESTTSDSQLGKIYPYALSDEELAKEPVGVSALVSKETNDDGIGLVFSTVKVVELVKTIKPEDLPEEARKYISEYAEVYGKKKALVQTYDVLWVPHEGGLIDIRTDCLEDMSSESVKESRAHFRSVVSEFLPEEEIRAPINLFPAITRIYESKTEGKVKELFFGTATSSVKRENMKHGLCLRDEAYHVHGKAGLKTPIEPFRLSVLWEIPMAGDVISSPELALNGSYRMSKSADPVLTSALFINCAGLSDFEYVKSRLECYIKPSDPDGTDSVAA